MAQKKHILLIEDEQEIAAIIKLHADICGYKLFVEVDGVNGYNAILRSKPDLILLDIMLPGKNGLDICRKVKSSSELKNIPLIIISAKTEEIDEILGLELGADDYVKKPFSPKVLFSRIKTVLRRSKENSRQVKTLSFGDFVMEIDRYLLRCKESIIPVTLSEFGILKRLVLNKGKVLSRLELIDDVNNDDSFIVDRNIDVHIAALRKKLGSRKKWIETVRGIGYRFSDDVVK